MSRRCKGWLEGKLMVCPINPLAGPGNGILEGLARNLDILEANVDRLFHRASSPIIMGSV